MTTGRWILLACLGGAAAAGCIHNVNTVERAEPMATPQVVNDKRVEADSGLVEKAKCVGVRETVVGDLVKIQVEIYNSTTQTQTIHYRFEWYDSAGIFVDSPMSIWKSETLQAKETKPLVSIAPNPNARDFRLKLQESN
jgi:uncharacterized protein YcfL